MQKTLLAALALSPGNKAITDIDEKTVLVVEDRDEYFRVFHIDIKKGDVVHCNDNIAGLNTLQEWVENRAYIANIDILDKRWLSLEESMREQGESVIAGVSGGLLRWQG
jgi:hypothetical protein